MDRRSFFKFGLDKTKEAAINAAHMGLKMKFKRQFIRPPGAVPEEEFLITCTRCGDCEKVCPHGAVHLVDQLTAGVYLRTPFIDPYFKACQYCESMPCITACKPGALRFPANGKPIKIAKVKFTRKHCLIDQGQHCDYCFNSCPTGVQAISKDDRGHPKFSSDLCVGCGRCAYICVSQTGKAIEMEVIS